VTTPDQADLLSQVADLAVQASEGDLAKNTVVEDGRTLGEMGMSSLAYLRLIDSIENDYGIYIDLEEAGDRFQTLHGIVDYMAEQGAQPTD
jgi:acyl carrier protein